MAIIGLAVTVIVAIAVFVHLRSEDSTLDLGTRTTATTTETGLASCTKELADVANTFANTSNPDVLFVYGEKDPRREDAMKIAANFRSNRITYGAEKANEIGTEEILNACINYLASPTTTVEVQPSITISRPSTTATPNTTRPTTTTLQGTRVNGPSVRIGESEIRFTASGFDGPTSSLDYPNVVIIERHDSTGWAQDGMVAVPGLGAVAADGFATADVTGDGRPDLILTSVSTETMSAVITDDGSTGWHPATFTDGTAIAFLQPVLTVENGRLASHPRGCIPDCATGGRGTVEWAYGPDGTFTPK